MRRVERPLPKFQLEGRQRRGRDTELFAVTVVLFISRATGYKQSETRADSQDPG